MFARHKTYRLYRQTKTRTANIAIALIMLASAFGSTLPLLTSERALAAPTTVFSEAELVSALADSGYDTITLGQNITTTGEVVINRPVTVNGGGFALLPNFSFVSNSADNSVVEIVNTNSVTLANLTIDGTNGTAIHGINIYKSTGVQLDGVTSKNNDKSGIVVNGSTVTVSNVQTAGNTWHGINVDLGSGVTEPAVLTVNGASNQTDTVHIFVDNTAEDVTVNDTNSQYATFTSGNSKTYMLKPVGTITAPTAGQFVAGTFNFTATYQDWDNGVKDDGVQWAIRKATCAAGTATVAGNVDGFNNPSTWSGAEFSASLNTTTWTDGEYCFVFNPTDDSGYPDVRETVTFVVDNTPPNAPTITSPSEGQYFTSTPILNKWTAATDSSGIKTYQIAYHYDDGHAFGDSTCSGLTMPGYSGFIGCRDLTATQRSHTPASSEQGGVTIWVRALDKAGNWSEWSIPVHYYYDATPPNKPVLLSPANGVPINGSNPVANDWTDVADAHHYIYESYNVDSSGNCIMSPIRFNSTYTESKTNSRVLADGLKFCWRVKAVDAAGNESEWSDLWMTIVDNTAPVIEINGTTPKATYKMNEPINVHVIDDNFDRVEVDRIDAAAPDNDKHWVYTGEWFGLWWLQDGTYRLTAYDKAGNTTVHEFITDETRPVVTGSTEPAFNPASFTITATDNSSGIQRVTGNIYKYDPAHPNADGEGYHLLKGNSSTTQNPFTVALGSLDEGMYYVKYNAQDIVGNTSNTEKFYFTVDHTAPVVTVDDYTGTDTTPDITGTVDDLSITTVTVTVNGESYDVTPVAGVWTLLGSDLVAPLAVGTYDVTASATDAAGNTGTDATTDEVTVEAEEETNGETQGAFTNNSSDENQGDNGNQNNGQDGNGEEEEENKAVESLNTTSSGDEDNTELVENAASTKFLGLGWWWAGILGALALFWLLFFARRRANED